MTYSVELEQSKFLTAAGLFFGCTVASFLLGFPVLRWLKRQRLVDLPNERSCHVTPTLRGGGIGIMAGIVAGAVALCLLGDESPEFLVVCLGAIVLAVISLLDDRFNLPVSWRFLGHAAIATVTLLMFAEQAAQGELLRYHSRPFLVLYCVIGALWLIGYTNAFNFMDGINGIAAGQAAVTGLGMALLSGFATEQWTQIPLRLSLIMSGAAVGFLPHNFPRARMFMGDVGSIPLGFMCAVLVLWLGLNSGWQLLIPLTLLHSNFILDAAITLSSRIWRRQPWMESHREHFYQKLIQTGRSHSFVMGWEMALQGLVVVLMVLFPLVSFWIQFCLGAAVVAIWLIFFAFAHSSFRRAHVGRSCVDSALPEAKLSVTRTSQASR